MFGKNGIVGRKFFADAADRLLVTSMFMTLQGEGPLRGEPAFFIRLAKCNLACIFCDTFFDKGDWFTFDQLDDQIDSRIIQFFKSKVPNWAHKGLDPRRMALVITGGEPSLQTNLFTFLERFRPQFKKMQIESNGILYSELPPGTIRVVSPKCVEHEGKAIKYIQPSERVLDSADCLKFVMNADMESPYSTVPHWAIAWHERTGRDVFVSPMNIYNDLPQKAKAMRAAGEELTLETRSTVDEVISFWEPGLLNMAENKKNHEYAANYAIRQGFIFNVQIHLLASVA